MNLINPTVELITQDPGIEGLYKQIELVGRSCWMSQNAIKEGSAKKFVEQLKNNQHTSCLEHGTVYMTIPKVYSKDNTVNDILKLKNNKYTEYISDDPQGILFESIIDGYSEYYSAELAQKVRRGNR